MFIVGLTYLALPVFALAFTFFSMPFVVLTAVALVIIIFCLYNLHLSEHNNPVQVRSFAKYWPLLLVSLLVIYLCVALPFDSHCWRRHFATLNLLVETAWPSVLDLDGEMYFLRYYLAWFIPPTLIAKVFDQQLLIPAMFVWTASGLFIAMLLAFNNLRKASHFFVAALIFLFFSGLDLIGAWLTGHIANPLTPHWLHWWPGERLLSIVSNVSSLQYAPQHALTVYLTTCLFLFNRQLAVKYGALILIVATMWSPFCVVGLFPIALYSLVKEGWKTALTPQNLLAAPLLAIPSFLYLTQGMGQITHMFTWENDNFSLDYFLVFLVVEFLLLLGIFYCFLKNDRPLIALTAIFMCVICMYKIGLWNDLISRAAMPTICIMSIWMIKCLLNNRGWRRELLIAYMCISSMPVLVELVVGINTPLHQATRAATFKLYLHLRPDHERDIYRNQNLVSVGSARSVYGMPLMRGIGTGK